MATSKPKLRPEFLAGHPSIDLITVDEVGHLLGVSRHTVWRRMKNPEFPQPIKQAKTSRWRLAEIKLHIDAAAASRPAPRKPKATGAAVVAHSHA